MNYPKAFRCPNCGSPVEQRAPGHSATVACGACQSIIDVTDPVYSILYKAEKKRRYKPHLPIGSRGTFEGEPWEVVGFMVRQNQSVYKWREYLLFNPYLGFRWLAESDGHWTLYKPQLKAPPRPHSPGRINFERRPFKLFDQGVAVVDYVMGEFYWRVKVGDKVETFDYICPPQMISIEREKREINWSVGEYVSAKEMRAAFGTDVRLPDPYGVGANQPSASKNKLRKLMPFALLLGGALLVSQMVFSNLAKEEKMIEWSRGKEWDTALPNEEHVSARFTLPHKSNLEIKVNTDLINAWAEWDVWLYNETTGKTTPFIQGAEFYRGYEGGESWSEGDQSHAFFLNDVPAGTYTIREQLTATDARYLDYRFQVTWDRSVWGYFWIALLVIALPVLWYALRDYMVQAMRWSQSNTDFYK